MKPRLATAPILIIILPVGSIGALVGYDIILLIIIIIIIEQYSI